MKIEKFNEGIWAIPKNSVKRDSEGKKYIAKIEKLKKQIYPIFGDDLLFDEFDGAIKRIEELMELPDDQIKESYESLDDNEIYEFNLKMKDIREIIMLVMETDFDMSTYDKKQIEISFNESQKSIYGEGGKYIFVNIPMANKDGKYNKYGFELKIWEDGFVSYENGNGIMMKFDNALEVYKILIKNIK